MGPLDDARLLSHSGVIRHRGKLEAERTNSVRFLDLDMESADLDEPALATMNAPIERLVRNDVAQCQRERKRFKRPTASTDRRYRVDVFLSFA